MPLAPKPPVTYRDGVLEAWLASQRAQMADRLIPLPLRGGRILDLGCGATPLFLARTTFREKYGIDLAPHGFEAERGIVLRTMDLKRHSALPFRPDYFDAVTMLAVLEHVEPEAVPTLFAEVRRVLKPGGRFVLTTPCPWAGPLLRIMAGLGLVSAQGVAEHTRTYHRATVTALLVQEGFERVKMRTGYFELCLNSWAYAEK